MSDAKKQAALSSIGASIVITAGKAFAGLATGSLALISDAAHSLLDVVATTITYLAIRAASKPADEQHHYGHGKVESIAALIETAFLFLLSGAVAMEGIRRLWQATTIVDFHWSAVAILVISIGIDAWRWTTLKRVAKQTNSEALAADALHFSSDLMNSILVLLALGASAMGYPQADSLVALGVAGFIAVAGFQLAKRTLSTLLDAAPEGAASRIREIVSAIPGVVAIDEVRVRASGADQFADIEIGVPRTMPLDRLGAIRTAIETAVGAAFSEARVTVTATPRAMDEETILERVLLIAAKRRVPIHHVTVQDLPDRLSVSLDLEIDGSIRLGDAHAVASHLEAAIRDELGPLTEVETHIEPLVASSLTGRDVAPERRDAVEQSLIRRASEDTPIHDVHSVRVRETDHGLIVNYHCRVDPDLDVTHVHEAVDRLEHAVKSDIPDILRIVSHTEPLKAVPA